MDREGPNIAERNEERKRKKEAEQREKQKKAAAEARLKEKEKKQKELNLLKTLQKKLEKAVKAYKGLSQHTKDGIMFLIEYKIHPYLLLLDWALTSEDIGPEEVKQVVDPMIKNPKSPKLPPAILKKAPKNIQNEIKKLSKPSKDKSAPSTSKNKGSTHVRERVDRHPSIDRDRDTSKGKQKEGGDRPQINMEIHATRPKGDNDKGSSSEADHERHRPHDNP